MSSVEPLSVLISAHDLGPSLNDFLDDLIVGAQVTVHAFLLVTDVEFSFPRSMVLSLHNPGQHLTVEREHVC